MNKAASQSALRKSGKKKSGRSATSRSKPAWGENIQSTEEQRQAREAILFETAARLFNRYGFHGTSMAQLTEELGLTKGALYYYVNDKSDLLYQLHIRSARATRLAHDRGVAEGRNGYERIHLVVKHYIKTVTTSPTETFILMEDGALKPEQADEIMKLRKQLEYDLRKCIQEGIDDGSIAPCDPKMASFAIVGAMAWVSKWYDPAMPWTSDQVSSGMAELLSRMIAANPVPALPTDTGQS
ncbi:TetR/AcrR family transcriptional regulator [Lutimaribacter sp. EGI FJ00015]|uniref:TetR/AcrR family transcriptional regulator n=1 Tax=Lutimaribacter degradans TaxID=2945989 RepID=A0ACC5ZWQ1_9RHOB|nr:TetR/AcrR family transcriptional regulator [Lutimaribacter sp. EGI FJ00013]MCO0613450.1 TetR/AcrR family transcriptional regulator [Lutimaribacter sp. EGI FJ00015]MCO0636424.1 TetR/AcrR family transcriptional regulator [Lutimaribacter sp. EGI FJ00014]